MRGYLDSAIFFRHADGQGGFLAVSGWASLTGGATRPPLVAEIRAGRDLVRFPCDLPRPDVAAADPRCSEWSGFDAVIPVADAAVPPMLSIDILAEGRACGSLSGPIICPEQEVAAIAPRLTRLRRIKLENLVLNERERLSRVRRNAVPAGNRPDRPVVRLQPPLSALPVGDGAARRIPAADSQARSTGPHPGAVRRLPGANLAVALGRAAAQQGPPGHDRTLQAARHLGAAQFQHERPAEAARDRLSGSQRPRFDHSVDRRRDASDLFPLPAGRVARSRFGQRAPVGRRKTGIRLANAAYLLALPHFRLEPSRDLAGTAVRRQPRRR